MTNYQPRYYDKFTVEQLETVADDIRQLLDGKRYTFVAVNEAMHYRPEVHTSQEMREVTTYYGANKEFGGLHIHDSYGVWGFMTDNVDSLRIDHCSIKATFKAGAGNLIHWVVMLEDDRS